MGGMPPVVEGPVADVSDLVLRQRKIVRNVSGNICNCALLLRANVVRFADAALVQHNVKGFRHILHIQIAARRAACHISGQIRCYPCQFGVECDSCQN